MQDVKSVVKNTTYAGLFFVVLAILMYEILLTRIFSVTMWYHFAFMAISVAMFGMTVGAIIVYLLPGYFTREKVKYHLALSSLLFSLSIVFSFLTYLCIPFPAQKSFTALYSLALMYIVIAIPFIFSGISVSLALTKFPGKVSKLYAADLAGAAIGCIMLIYVLEITDGPTAVIVVSAFAAFGALLFALEGKSKRLLNIAVALTLLFIITAGGHTILVNKQIPFLRLMWVKGELESPGVYEKWNAISRIRVDEAPDQPFGWGSSPTLPGDIKIRQLGLLIDASAGTVLTEFDGDLSKLDYLKYDITNMVHYIKSDARVLVVGSGGGRDILSAMLFGQKSILGVELNEDIISTVNEKFGDFTGHLDQYPNVTFVSDEARSYIARSDDSYDIIQVSLIDTWAATASGAFVLAENSLYTIEAWRIFLDHLNPEGILTFSRWYFESKPVEIYRLTSLAVASLLDAGIENPRDHIILTANSTYLGGLHPDGVGTILVSKTPFTNEAMDSIDAVSERMQFKVLLSPEASMDSNLVTIASGVGLGELISELSMDISAPTDDNPFFFNMLRFRDMFNLGLHNQGVMSFNMKAVLVLGALLIIVIGLSVLCIIVPLILTTKRVMLKGAFPLFVFFASIGLGFMLIEISQMQRLIVFLGHPVYGLSVVLFSLLLSSGLGSYTTHKIVNPKQTGTAGLRLILLLLILVIFGLLTPLLITNFQGATTPLRILIAVIILFPLGLFMGMPFPIGMKLASSKSEVLTPWLWGINGAMSVVASVLAIALAISFSISTSFWTGFAVYIIALAAFHSANRRQ